MRIIWVFLTGGGVLQSSLRDDAKNSTERVFVITVCSIVPNLSRLKKIIIIS